ncbi:MAG TPA: HAMP domain-containing sensor histidine kinase [Acidobacteriaceae bacterium]|jgi:signal transduction histidine kinase|nr:HAMP domain-containing sensor histidine kinase [Acidobacteriaceae bacterium]
MATTNFITFLSYISICGTLLYLARRTRRALVRDWAYFLLAFALFIVACGSTHLMEVVTTWSPAFWVDAWTNIITAVLSGYVAVQLILRVNLLGAGINDYAHQLENSAVAIEQISEGRRAEAQLRILQVQYTTELEQSKSELERVDRLKSEFLASMSHELRTPLHTIIGFTELLQDEGEGGLSTTQKRFLRQIQGDSQHLLQLINRVLDLSKIEAGQLDLKREEYPLEQSIREAHEAIRPGAELKGIRVEDHGQANAMVHADRVRIREMLYNLLSNAVKFTPEGGVVWIKSVEAGGFVHVTVGDTGIGIPHEEQSNIFDRFYQVGTTTRGIREGTGLGLPITRQLAEMHGGWIEVKSVPGAGSEFIFALPVAGAAARS